MDQEETVGLTERVKVLAPMPDDKFNPWGPCGGREESTPVSCPLTSTHVLWHSQTQTDRQMDRC